MSSSKYTFKTKVNKFNNLHNGTLVMVLNSLNQSKADQINDIFNDAKVANTKIMIRN